MQRNYKTNCQEILYIGHKHSLSCRNLVIYDTASESLEISLLNELNPLSPKIDFYVDLLICATFWASKHKFMLLSKIFQEMYYL